METVLTIGAIWAGAIALAIIIEVATRPHGGRR